MLSYVDAVLKTSKDHYVITLTIFWKISVRYFMSTPFVTDKQKIHNSKEYEMLCVISYYLYNVKNEKNIHGGVLLLVKPAALLKVTLYHVCVFLVFQITQMAPNHPKHHICNLVDNLLTLELEVSPFESYIIYLTKNFKIILIPKNLSFFSLRNLSLLTHHLP